MRENYIVLSAGAFAAGIWFGSAYFGQLGVMIGLVLAVIMAAAFFIVRGMTKPGAACVLLLFFLTGAIRFTHADIVPSTDISRFAGKTATISAVITEAPEITPIDYEKSRIRYIVDVLHVHGPQGQLIPASGKLTAALFQDKHAAVGYSGDKVVFTAKISEPQNYNNPGSYDFVGALKRQGITARASIVKGQFSIVAAGEGGWKDYIANLRRSVKLLLDRVMTADQSALLFGMLFGGYAEIPKQVVKDFAATGLVHILSVSGTHIALVAGVIAWTGRSLGLRHGATAAAAGVIILLYGLFAGFTPPVARSAAMGIISLTAVAIGREKDARTALALSAAAMLIHTPGLIFDLSFQLSFAATAGLIFLYPPILEKLRGWMPVWLAAGLGVTLAAQLSVIPIIANYFNSVSISAFAANIIIVPVIEAIVVFGLAGVLAAAVWPFAGSAVLALCGLAVGAVMNLTSLFAGLPGSSIYIPPIGLPLSAAYYLFIAWCWGWKPVQLPIPAVIRTTGAVRLLTACIAIGIILFTYWPKPAAVHFIDVGQGDAILVTTPRGRAVLIDTGGVPGEGSFDIGERIVVPYLKHYGVLTLDYLILTHGHQDHAGGAAAVAASVPTRNILLASEAHSAAVTKLITAKTSGRFIPVHEGQAVLLDGVKFEVVHAAAKQSSVKNGNESSTVIRVSFGEHSFLITGDLTEAEEMKLVNRGISSAAVLKVAHHGAKSSTSTQFLQAVNPDYAVISVGRGNRYGHPHRETLDKLKANSVTFYRTDLHGAVVFKTDGCELIINTFMK